MHLVARVLVLLLGTSLIAGCSNLTTAQQRALSGGAIGAAAGGALLAITGGPILLGAALGAGAGAVTGAVTGR
jgi:osmotically inducible lipoprotein OsmB